ncbi:uncharacterized protein K489DRAFT_322201 [Dissoconium aciculare CBS 342.82]|uniref:DUF202 domain-containing protein n=1 Tax=Dissoconium aciculare CBS 342.82 TaxID=1314786 RepID=A0A6J3M0V9_9PEZI|nr:uncharacterized protein K489DRAFT_322201 [Dissoconium aciculare CBS 342.82]KAF1821675.1 hypothetical protein K489DRAFT_322201 [Dissoconium aciculare CBS 342.82]
MTEAVVYVEERDRRALSEPYRPLYSPFSSKPVLVHQRNDFLGNAFTTHPYLGALLFDNENSEARDHAAAERTFLSWLRLAIYMAVVAVAIMVSFHLKRQPTAIELKVAAPLGLIFWLLSLACLISGLHNYVKTVNHYSTRQAIVQSGLGTQLVFTVIASAIVAACILFLSTGSEK